MPVLIAIARTIKLVVEHPIARLLVGLSIAGTGLDDLLEQFSGEEGVVDVDVHHGAILFGAVHMLRALADVLEGMESVGSVLHSKSDG